jgi:hypothetical protein
MHVLWPVGSSYTEDGGPRTSLASISTTSPNAGPDAVQGCQCLIGCLISHTKNACR